MTLSSSSGRVGAGRPRDRAYLSLGSNIGDRQANLHAGVQRLRGLLDELRMSRLYETEPVEVTDQPRFLNAVVTGLTDRSPRTLLAEALAIERALGRDRARERPKGPRPLDIDLLLYGTLVSDGPDPLLPHPRMLARAFVLVPLLELAPDLVDPRTGEPYAVALARIGAAGVYPWPWR